jgi:hypothetical protein
MPLTRVGAGAAQIRVAKDANITDISKKIKTALQMDFPHMKAECLKNAAKSVGKYFGRDLNRDYFEKYEPMIKAGSELVKRTKQHIKDSTHLSQLEECEPQCNTEELQNLYKTRKEELTKIS